MDTAALIEQSQQLALDMAPKILAAIAIFVIGRWIAKALAGLVRKMLKKLDADAMLVKFVGNLAYALLLTVVVLAALGKLGVQTTSFIAVLGAAGLAIGLAMQDSLSNFAAGVMVVLFRPYKVGDYVEAGGVSGSVEEVQIFTTVLNTPDNKKVIVPNGQIVSNTITNYSAYATRRVDMIFGSGYDDNVGLVKKVLSDIIDSNDRILSDPEPQIVVKELAESSVNFAVRVWVNTSDYWPVYFETTEAVKNRFEEEGISIPFPQQDVHMHTHQSEQAAA